MKKAIDKPFTKELLAKASKLAQGYHIKIESHDRLGYVGCGTEFFTVFADGETVEKCEENIREALTVAIAAMLEMGRELPKIKG